MKLLMVMFVVALSLFAGGSASAHVLKTDGTIGAVLHVKPDDNPQKEVPTSYALNFRDTAGKFAVADCDCVVSIATGGSVVTVQQLKTQGRLIGGNTTIFPKDGVYELRVAGTPKENAQFNSFSFSYSLRVGAGDNKREAQNIPPLLWLGMASMIGLILLAATRLQDEV